MKFDIWIEGYLCSGMEGIPAKAQKLASDIEGNSFIEACKNWYNNLKNPQDYGTLTLYNNIPKLWGCKLFNNESDARKLYG